MPINENIAKFVRSAVEEKPADALDAFNSLMDSITDEAWVELGGEIAKNLLQPGGDDDEEEIDVDDLDDDELRDLVKQIEDDEESDEDEDDAFEEISNLAQALESLPEDEFDEVWEEIPEEVQTALIEYTEAVDKVDRLKRIEELYPQNKKAQSADLKSKVKDWVSKGNKIKKLEPGSARGIKPKKISPMESENIEELSKGKLGAYIRAASTDRAENSPKFGSSSEKTRNKAWRKESNRAYGIGRAVSKLTKESEVSESKRGESDELRSKVKDWVSKGNKIKKLDPGSARGIKPKKISPIDKD